MFSWTFVLLHLSGTPKNVVGSLSTSANTTLLHGQDDDTCESDEADNRTGDDDDDDTFDEIELAPGSNFDDVVSQLNVDVIKLQPQSPSETKIIEPAIVNIKVRKPPHCSQCHHVKLGHSRISSTLSKCSFCTDGICSGTLPQTPCNCTWHASHNLATDL